MKKMYLVLLALAVISLSGCSDCQKCEKVQEKPHWVYEGDLGPYHWGKVSVVCAEGKSQSPINIITGNTIGLDSKNVLEFHESTEAVLSHEIDNGHAVKITPEDDHGISINGDHYKLLQYHFHGRSENYINGKQYAMEMHLVHQNSKGELAVVGIMIEEGKHNSIFESVIGHMNGGDLNVATADLLPKDLSKYYHFMGSLTTPPCSENVKWYILKDTITLDENQLIAFRKHHYYNFRPLQKLNGRKIQAN